jgi:hypothetical protein
MQPIHALSYHRSLAGVASTSPCYPTPMCGRYTLTMDKSTIKKHLGVKFYIAADLRLVADV